MGSGWTWLVLAVALGSIAGTAAWRLAHPEQVRVDAQVQAGRSWRRLTEERFARRTQRIIRREQAWNRALLPVLAVATIGCLVAAVVASVR